MLHRGKEDGFVVLVSVGEGVPISLWRERAHHNLFSVHSLVSG
jgi:hypothetical protein